MCVLNQNSMMCRFWACLFINGLSFKLYLTLNKSKLQKYNFLQIIQFIVYKLSEAVNLILRFAFLFIYFRLYVYIIVITSD